MTQSATGGSAAVREPVPRSAVVLSASVACVFDLSFGQMLWSRRSVFLVLLLVGPVLSAALVRVVATMSVVGTFRVSGARIGGATIFGLMIWLLYIRFIVPVLGVFTEHR